MTKSPGIGGAVARTAAVTALAAVLAACAANPFGALWQLTGFASNELAAMEPAALRVAVKLPRPVRARTEGAFLKIQIRDERGKGRDSNWKLPLALVNEGRTVRVEALPSSEPGYSWYLFKLTPDGERQLARLQDERVADGSAYHGPVSLYVEHGYVNATPGQQISRSVWIQLADGEGFSELVGNEAVTIGKQGAHEPAQGRGGDSPTG